MKDGRMINPKDILYVRCSKCGELGEIPNTRDLFNHADLTVCVSNLKGSWVSQGPHYHNVYFFTPGQYELERAGGFKGWRI